MGNMAAKKAVGCDKIEKIYIILVTYSGCLSDFLYFFAFVSELCSDMSTLTVRKLEFILEEK